MPSHLHPRSRLTSTLFATTLFFSFFVVVRVTAQLLYQDPDEERTGFRLFGVLDARQAGLAILAVVVLATAYNSVRTARYVLSPQYTWVTAAHDLTRYIDEHPNGNRLLVSISGDEITLITHLPSLCDDFGTLSLPAKLALYKPGWYASWNSLDPGTLEDLHEGYSLEQVDEFPAFDDPDRNDLYLFKLHPLPNGEKREAIGTNLQVKLPGDKFDAPIE